MSYIEDVTEIHNSAPQTVNLRPFPRGSYRSWGFSITLYNEDGTSQGLPLTNNTVRFIVKDDEQTADADAVINIAVTEHKDAANGKTEIKLPSAMTKELEAKTYFYTISIEYGGTVESVRVFQGTLTLGL